ncbi:MAG: tetratricopeptide repeat protein [Polyangiaceae bacterium]
MRSRQLVRCSLFALGAAAALTLFAPAASARECGPAPDVGEPSAEARAANDEAINLSKAGKTAEALEAFQRAYDLSPSWVILYNIGKMAALTGDSARALAAYECHLAHGGEAVEPKRRAEVEAELRRLRGEVGLVAVEVPEAELPIELDGVEVGRSPLASPVYVNPGSHLVRIKRAGKTESRVVEVARGARVIVTFDGAPAPTTSGASFRFPSGAVGAAWIVAGLTGVGTLVTGTLALIGERDIEDDTYLGPSRRPPAGSDLASKIDTTRSLAVATDVLLSLFIVSGSCAIAFSVVNSLAKEPDQPAARIKLGPGFASLEVDLP